MTFPVDVRVQRRSRCWHVGGSSEGAASMLMCLPGTWPHVLKWEAAMWVGMYKSESLRFLKQLSLIMRPWDYLFSLRFYNDFFPNLFCVSGRVWIFPQVLFFYVFLFPSAVNGYWRLDMRPCLARGPCVLTFDLAAADKRMERKLAAGTGTGPSVYTTVEDSV